MRRRQLTSNFSVETIWWGGTYFKNSETSDDLADKSDPLISDMIPADNVPILDVKDFDESVKTIQSAQMNQKFDHKNFASQLQKITMRRLNSISWPTWKHRQEKIFGCYGCGKEFATEEENQKIAEWPSHSKNERKNKLFWLLTRA